MNLRTIILLGITFAFAAAGGGPPIAGATHTGGADGFSIDMEPDAAPANTSTSVGSIEFCARLNENNLLDADETAVDRLTLDVVTGPAGIPASNPIAGFTFVFEYPADKILVKTANASYLLASGESSNVVGYNEAVPDSNGSWLGSALDLSTATESRPGVLERLTIESTTSAVPGVFPLALASAT